MTGSIEFICNQDYLLTTIPDTSITVDRAQEILENISLECSRLHCNKVILDERSVNIREIPPHEIMKLSEKIKTMGLNKIHIAFWCQSHLINRDSSLLSAFTFNTEYVIKHFSNKEEAIIWLEHTHPATIT